METSLPKQARQFSFGRRKFRLPVLDSMAFGLRRSAEGLEPQRVAEDEDARQGHGAGREDGREQNAVTHADNFAIAMQFENVGDTKLCWSKGTGDGCRELNIPIQGILRHVPERR